MTVCVGAFAERSQAIVLVSDKALTYGGPQAPMQSDSDIKKIVPIGRTAWRAAIAGDPGVAEKIIRVAATEISKHPEVSRSCSSMMGCLERAFQDVREKTVVDEVLRPRLLTKDFYIARGNTLLPLHDDLFLDTAQRIDELRIDCELLLCGFDSHKKAHMFSVRNPGVAENRDAIGYWAIGVGTDVAMGRLLWVQEKEGVTRRTELSRVLYAVLDAKAHAEQIQSVGYAWDAIVITAEKVSVIPREIRGLIDGVFNVATLSPFEKKKFPHRWQRRLRDFSTGLIRNSSNGK